MGCRIGAVGVEDGKLTAAGVLSSIYSLMVVQNKYVCSLYNLYALFLLVTS